jgi:ribose-phosphate pyrophosphokinase
MEILHIRNSKGLATAVACKLAFPFSSPNVRCFGNNELMVFLDKAFVDVAVIAATANHDDWIELLLLLNALRSANDVTLCLSYMGYARQDHQNPNESFGGAVCAGLLETQRISRCIIVDYHGEPLLRVPTIHVSACDIFENDVIRKYNPNQIVIVSPDFGGARRAHKMARSLKCNFALCCKTRNVFGELKTLNLIGDVCNKICIFVDDMVDSGATLCHASEAAMKAGAREVVAYCTHNLLSPQSVKRIGESAISELVITDSISDNQVSCGKMRKLSLDSLIAQQIRYIM